MAPEQDDAVLPEGDLSSSSQDDEEEDDVVDEDDDDDVDVDDEDDVLNDDVINSGSPSLPVAIAAPTVTVALPAPITTAATAVVTPDPDPKRPRTVHYDPVILPQGQATEEKKPVAALDDSRRLFQRLWTDEDEIELLQGFLDYTTQRGGKGASSSSSSHPNDTALFYDQIKSKLQLEFNKNQLVEKLRRLKKKYRNLLNKIASGKEVSFKSPHDQATFEISRKIWSNIGGGVAAVDDDDAGISHHNTPNFNGLDIIKTEEPSKPTPRSRKRSRPQQAAPPRFDEKRGGGYAETVTVVRDNNNNNINNSHNSYNGGGGNGFGLGNCNVQGMIEETVKSCLSPLFKELMSNGVMGGGGGASRGFGGLSLNPIPLSFGGPSMNLNLGGGEAADEKWRKQQVLELEVYSKRLALVQSQIQVALDELRSTGGGGG